jgi:NTE family protein
VLSGGGARGAYEAGVIHFIRTQLPNTVRNRRFDIYSGTSVGAINACFLASTAHTLAYQGSGIYQLWRNLTQADVYKRNLGELATFVKDTSLGLAANLAFGVHNSGRHFHGLLNSAPLLPTISRTINFAQLARNIRENHYGAIALVATNVASGAVELFIDKNDSVAYTGVKKTHIGPIEPQHAMASAAIPIIFPAVMINGVPYIDGGLRLNTPLSPSVQLGADRILSIGLHYAPDLHVSPESVPDQGYPSLGQILGRVMNNIFLDRTKSDVEQMQRINRIIEWGENTYGEDFLAQINQKIQHDKIRGDIAERGLKKIEILSITPSQDISDIFIQCYQRESVTNRSINFMEQFLARVMDISPESGADFLSYLAFMPSFLNSLLELGFEDARAHTNELTGLLSQS